MWNRIREIVRKELLQALREPRMRTMLFAPPVLQLIIFGYAVNLDVERASIAWMDQDHTPASRELLADFAGSTRFSVDAYPDNEREIQRLLDRGNVQAAVRVLPGFARNMERGRTPAVQILVDGANSNTASLISSYASHVVADYAARALRGQRNSLMLSRGASSPVNLAMPEVAAGTRVWFNPDLRSRNYFVPGVMVNIIMLVTLSLTALAIAREKEIGTMEQLMVTPIRPLELMLGKTLPFAMVGLFDVALITSVAMLVFRIPFRGNPLLLLVSAILFLLTTLGSGLFLSTTANTQQQAMMSTTFFSIPAFMLSGFAFPIHNMPVAVQYLTYLNPLRYFMEIVRGVFLKGAGFDALWPNLLALSIYGVAVIALSAARFHKRLD